MFVMNKKLSLVIIIFISIIIISIISTILYIIFKKPSKSTSTSSVCNFYCINGICNNNDVCICNKGYKGHDCSVKCCSNNGVCKDDGTCICDPKFVGNNCDKCVNDKFADNNCTECKGNFAGNNCTECKGNYSGDNCTECKGNFRGDNCVECKSNYTGDNCEKCINMFDPSSDCTKCIPMFNGDKCDKCDELFYISDGNGGCNIKFSLVQSWQPCFLTFNLIGDYINYYPCKTKHNDNKYKYNYKNNSGPFFLSSCDQRFYSFLWDNTDIMKVPSSDITSCLTSSNNTNIKPVYYKLHSQTAPIIFDIIYKDVIIGTAELSTT